MLSVLPFTLYPLVADSAWLGPLKGTQSTLAQTSAYHMLSSESLLGIPIQAFAETVIGFLVFGTALMMTGAGKFFINVAFALSVSQLALPHDRALTAASLSLCLGAATMPLVCYLAAWRKPFRHLFFVPVAAVAAGVAIATFEVLAR